ncbi:MAG TPA: hypothetical protein VK550_36070 [Polyangiaceae bacterium]|nr:hypothetical protein [Polyangiaceae bacterium]
MASGIRRISGVSMTYLMCVRSSEWCASRIARWALSPAVADAVVKALRKLWKSTQRVVVVSE